jgi:hypothetical protein
MSLVHCKTAVLQDSCDTMCDCEHDRVIFGSTLFLCCVRNGYISHPNSEPLHFVKSVSCQTYHPGGVLIKALEMLHDTTRVFNQEGTLLAYTSAVRTRISVKVGRWDGSRCQQISMRWHNSLSKAGERGGLFPPRTTLHISAARSLLDSGGSRNRPS